MGASNDCDQQIRMSKEVYICISSSGREHSGSIEITFEDTDGRACSYGEWQLRQESPAVPIELVCGVSQC